MIRLYILYQCVCNTTFHLIFSDLHHQHHNRQLCHYLVNIIYSFSFVPYCHHMTRSTRACSGGALSQREQTFTHKCLISKGEFAILVINLMIMMMKSIRKHFVICCYWWWWNIGLHPQMAFPLGINCQDCHHAWICFRGGRKYDSMVSGERFSSKSTQNLSLVPDWVVGRVYLPSSRATHYHVRILHSQRHSGHLDFQKGDHDLGVSDTHVLLLNEYIVELNPANFNILNQILNWIFLIFLNWNFFWIELFLIE